MMLYAAGFAIALMIMVCVVVLVFLAILCFVHLAVSSLRLLYHAPPYEMLF